MVMRRKSPEEGDWSKVIRAQDEISKHVLKEEQDLQKQSKILYKQELDKQMQLKSQILKMQHQDKTEEFSFHVVQQMAMKDFESRRKLNDRNHLLILQNGNKLDLENKVKVESFVNEKERMEEQERNRKAQKEMDMERIKEMSFRNRRIQEEQEEIRRMEKERGQRMRMMNLEKIQDKKMIEQRVSEMQSLELQYREFYDKRMQDLDQRMKNLQPLLDSGNSRQELIRRRNEEYERIIQEKSLLQSQIDSETRKRNLQSLKSSLDSQITEKHKQRLQEIQGDKYYLKIAQIKDNEEELRRYTEREKRAKDQEELKKAYEEQLKEKDWQVMQDLNMNYNEKKMHTELLTQLKHNKVVNFPGVPGSHMAESPIKKIFKKVYGNPVGRSWDGSERNKFSITPQPFVEFSYEHSGKGYKFPDPYKHDPITNPIGAEIPKVLPGQRVTKAPQSHSKLAMVGNTLFM